MAAPALSSAADPASEAFRANAQAHTALTATLRDKLAAARLGGGEKARARHTSRGKLLPRDRVDGLLDPGSPSSNWLRSPPTVCTTARPPRRG